MTLSGSVCQMGVVVLDVPQHVLQDAGERPRCRAISIEADDLGHQVEPSAHRASRIARRDRLCPSVVQRSQEGEARIARHGIGIDG